MYNAIILVLVAAGLLLAVHGWRRRRPWRLFAGIALVAATALGFWLLGLAGELLWFRALGFADRFWTEMSARGGIALAAALLAALCVWLVTFPLRGGSGARRAGIGAAAILGTMWGARSWQDVLVWVHGVSTGQDEPLLGLDTGFYLFTLPFLHALPGLGLIVVAASALVVVAQAIAESAPEGVSRAGSRGVGPLGPATASAAGATLIALGVVLAFEEVLGAFDLLQSTWGVVYGPGWVDAHVRLPGYAVAAAAVLAAGVLAAMPGVRRRIARRVRGSDARRQLVGFGTPWAGAVIVWILALAVMPGLFQWLYVGPNEITLEAPYIDRSIAFTRAGFALDRVEDYDYPVRDSLTAAMLDDDETLLEEVRLWDWRALDAVYQQFQEIRLYYEFADVDVDRYHLGADYKQVMVSAREIVPDNLPLESQTFVNRRFKYTHGYGITLAPVSAFTANGLPDLLVRDIPPVSEHPDLTVERPELYYGELTRSHVIVNSDEAEFDYPRGEENVYVTYEGEGGVPMGGLARKFLFGWKFDGTQLFLSDYPNAESRIMFHRDVRERVQVIAPFLTLDDDPYIVLAEGRLYWIVDAYTTSTRYPYSEPFDARETIQYRSGRDARALTTRTAPRLHGVNYIRNSVKAVVDAYDGDVDLYVFEPEDPVVRVWRRIFPELFTDREEMPDALAAHVRYPVDLLLVQGLVYAKYHMEDTEVFYNQEDLWVRATERYYATVEPVEPYYVMWRPPGAGDAEFILMLPFTPKNRQVLIGWIAGMCDGDNYGRFLAYQFPKEKRVLGPQQVETKIDQDPYLSAQLSLWDQRGSRVIRGNVLAIPIDETLLYVEPIYLQAETAAYPELRLVAVMHHDDLSYGESFDEALGGLFDGAVEARARASGLGLDGAAVEPTGRDALIRAAGDAFDAYLELQGERRFAEAAEALGRLQRALEGLRAELPAARETR